MDSKQGEILDLQDKLQGTKTALLDYQSCCRAKFEEQQKELESYKTKMEEYKDETVSLKRQIQEMRVSSCKKCEFRRLLDSISSRSTVSAAIATEVDQQHQHQHQQQSSCNCRAATAPAVATGSSSSSEKKQNVKTFDQKLSSSVSCYKTNTPDVVIDREEKTSSSTSGEKVTCNGCAREKLKTQMKSGKKNLDRYAHETEPTWVQEARVRVHPPTRTPQEIADYDPPVGSGVEIISKDEEESWWTGEVSNKKGYFYVIDLPDEDEMVTSEVEERERLRP